jgi:ubiquitin carboxyl-terminal hydrolase 22/27/51
VLADFISPNCPAPSLAECLARFTEPEILGAAAKMFCAQCGVRQEAMKQMSIRSLPPVLCFHFKRFEQSFAKIRKSEMVKIDTAVEFPVDSLDLSAFQTSSVVRKRASDAAVAGQGAGDANAMVDADADGVGAGGAAAMPGVPSIAGCDGDAVYDLFAVVNHTGKIDRGHYTTLVRRRGAWFKCDDEKVTSAPRVGNVIRSGEAYLVFYTQRKPNLTY